MLNSGQGAENNSKHASKPSKKNGFNHLSEVWVLQDFASKTYTVSQNPSIFKGVPLLISIGTAMVIVLELFVEKADIIEFEILGLITSWSQFTADLDICASAS